jgi:hypothetical protein
MNLSLTSFLKILLGAFLGAPIFWSISFLIPKGTLGSYEEILTTQQFGILVGAIFGAAVTTIVLIILDSRDPDTGAAANLTMINGMGSKFIGRSETQADGSYLTTEWFCLLWLPLFPVCNYRVVDVGGRTLIPFVAGSRQFMIKSKHPVRLKNVAKGYLITVCLGCVFGVGLAFFVSRA